MKCERCPSDQEAHFRVQTDVLNMLVCTPCANEARSLGLPVEALDKVGSPPAVLIGARRIVEKSSLQRSC